MVILSFAVAYALFSARSYAPLHDALVHMGYFGTFLAGFFYAYAFTAAPATAVLLILAKEQNIYFAGPVAGVGALLGDLVIFYTARRIFGGEMQHLSQSKIVLSAQRKMSNSLQRYLLVSVAGLLIATPLPTEIGVTLMSSIRNMSARNFSVIAYIVHTSAILIILLIGSTI